jgi:DNA invertase Pin-like site-specific DNA recombinase
MAERARTPTKRCAIYTRKSSEEGLEQGFNSLDAQREACEAYIKSQKHEGWKVVPVAYDDGGFSGGSLERPALQKLLADIKSGSIDVVVVYKVDRLTRSLADFAKVVEIFDAHGTSFVSITQQFNTTSSMGRLTLNILLSFAQFEREVTGERIRDKFAASKQKGLWMGGYVPLGYRANGRTLAIHDAEAAIVRTIFDLYRSSGSVAAVEAELQRCKLLRPPSATMGSGRVYGSRPFSRGEIYKLLANPVYAGDIGHKGKCYAGQHPAIVDRETFTAVRAQLSANSHARHVRLDAKDPSLLAGLLYDDQGRRFTPTHASKQGRRYRYYASQPAPVAIEGQGGHNRAERRIRIAASDIETVVTETLRAKLQDRQWLLDTVMPSGSALSEQKAMIDNAAELAQRLHTASGGERRELLLVLVARTVLAADEVRIVLRRQGLAARLGLAIDDVAAGGEGGADALHCSPTRPDRQQHRQHGHAASSSNHEGDGAHDHDIIITVSIALRRRGVETKLIVEGPGGADTQRQPDVTLIKVIAQAHRWMDDTLTGRFPTMRALAYAYDKDERYVARLLPLAFLAPSIVESILNGGHPVDLTAQELVTSDELSVAWQAQMMKLGFESEGSAV